MPNPKHHRHRILFERLESRVPLAGDVTGLPFGDWHNESNGSDVSGDGLTTPIDVLLVINLFNQYGAGPVADIQSASQSDVSAAESLAGGFHPDVNHDGFVTPIDVLRTINTIAERAAMSSDAGTVAIIPDEQGRPIRAIFTAANGSTVEFDVSDQDVKVTWLNGNAYLNNSDGLPIVIAKPEAGILSADYSTGDGRAIVTRFEPDGAKTVDEYVCVPGWNFAPEIITVVVEIVDPSMVPGAFPDDVRRPIVDFEEVLGSLVSSQATFADGTTIVREFVEASEPFLISVTATLPSGATATVNFSGSAFQLIDGVETGADLVRLLEAGFQASAPLTPDEFFAALAVTFT